MNKRLFWLHSLEEAWRRRSIVWLAGVRRVGKTCLCQTLPEVEYFDCELPRVRRLLEDPEAFFRDLGPRRVVLDEIHRLDNPSEVLKIAADHFPRTRIVATGSSVLGATRRFRDTLAGRKVDLWLTPLIASDLAAFGRPGLDHRFLFGGLPPYFLAEGRFPEKEILEWMDAFWAKDIQELFRLEKRHSLQKFLELLLIQSGGVFEATNLAKRCEASRQTIINYLGVLEATYVVHIVRPYSGRSSREITAQPKVYAFDTGFMACLKGWTDLRPEDRGICWEHFVLNEIQARLQVRTLHYWRDKQGHEIDFVIVRRGRPPVAIECKWRDSDLDTRNLKAFLGLYPDAECITVCSNVDRSYTRPVGAATMQVLNLEQLISFLSPA